MKTTGSTTTPLSRCVTPPLSHIVKEEEAQCQDNKMYFRPVDDHGLGEGEDRDSYSSNSKRTRTDDQSSQAKELIEALAVKIKKDSLAEFKAHDLGNACYGLQNLKPSPDAPDL
ncbi:MAG: hypothetical protein V4591_11925 [Bdellovibrionota bacterium]